ncbi:MAG: restriction endonuclease [Gordonia amarae]
MFSKKSPFLSPQQAESLAAAIMQKQLGFRDAAVTNLSGDGGVDVVSRHAVAQVKHWSSQVGRPALQQLYGARGADARKKLVFFSSGGYSPQAVEYADTHEVALFGFSNDSTWWAVNEHAKGLTRQERHDRRVNAVNRTFAAIRNAWNTSTMKGHGLKIGLVLGAAMAWIAALTGVYRRWIAPMPGDDWSGAGGDVMNFAIMAAVGLTLVSIMVLRK